MEERRLLHMLRYVVGANPRDRQPPEPRPDFALILATSSSEARGRLIARRGKASVQSIGSAVVDVTPGDYFEFIAQQTPGSSKSVAANEHTWFAIEVVE
jgi:hypothetical protein